MSEDVVTLRFVKEKETKGTVRFTEVEEPGKPPIVGTLYIRKWWCGTATSITMQIGKG
jgi:hypothetical protein